MLSLIKSRKELFVAFGLFALSVGAANAQGYNEYGLRRPMTSQESGRYERCQEAVRPMMWPEPVNGRQMTFSEALGPEVTKRLCACAAVRARTEADLGSVWQSCVRTVIGG